MRRRLSCVVVALILVSCTRGVDRVRTTPSSPSSSVPSRSHPVPDISAANAVAPVPPGPPPAGERDGHCPYIRTGLNQDPTSLPNVADIEGNRIYRTTILTRTSPVGCRFYFINPPYQATADIQPRRYSSAADARAAVLAIGARGSDATRRAAFVPGLDGVLFRTAFVAADRGRDWAFAFSKGPIVVVVRTEETTSSLNAELLAAAIAPAF